MWLLSYHQKPRIQSKSKVMHTIHYYNRQHKSLICITINPRKLDLKLQQQGLEHNKTHGKELTKMCLLRPSCQFASFQKKNWNLIPPYTSSILKCMLQLQSDKGHVKMNTKTSLHYVLYDITRWKINVQSLIDFQSHKIAHHIGTKINSKHWQINLAK